MEERMERERKVWNEHKELSLDGERAKFEEEKTRLLRDLQDQLKLEQERSQRLEQKLYDTQMVGDRNKNFISFLLNQTNVLMDKKRIIYFLFNILRFFLSFFFFVIAIE
jgi:hypothetical protein